MTMFMVTSSFAGGGGGIAPATDADRQSGLSRGIGFVIEGHESLKKTVDSAMKEFGSSQLTVKRSLIENSALLQAISGEVSDILFLGIIDALLALLLIIFVLVARKNTKKENKRLEALVSTWEHRPPGTQTAPAADTGSPEPDLAPAPDVPAADPTAAPTAADAPPAPAQPQQPTGVSDIVLGLFSTTIREANMAKRQMRDAQQKCLNVADDLEEVHKVSGLISTMMRSDNDDPVDLSGYKIVKKAEQQQEEPTTT
ncbi:MAG: hypothetical protein OYG31_00465 [Candidatus Kaiserbacteria bacterium]|nr:hypothetical protein [Candidatus Kaiserbacteria bacterium]